MKRSRAWGNSSAGKKFKKNYKRSVTMRRPAKSVASFVNPVAGPGSAIYSQFIYAEYGVLLNPGAASADAYVYNISSLFDPNNTGVGHQPTNFDQLMAIYEEYVVYAVKIRVTFSNSEVTAPVVVGCTFQDGNTTSSDSRRYIENGNTKYKLLSGSNGGGVGEIYMYCDVAKLHGMSRTKLLTSPDFKGTSSASPTESAYLHIWAEHPAGADVGSLNTTTEIVYYTKLMGNKLNALS